MAVARQTVQDTSQLYKPDTSAMTAMQKMARAMWGPWLAMGVMIVLTAFILGAVNAGANVAPYFENSKVARDTAETGSAIVADKVGIESLKAFIPGFKFLGLGLLFGGITFLLATILGTLRNSGYRVQAATGVEPMFPKPPMEARLFPMLMMMGFMILIATFIVGIWLTGQSAEFWNHSIATQIDAAQAGDPLLAQLGRINAVKAWQEPLKFVGVATMFVAIGLALATIVKVLRAQAVMMVNLVSDHEGHSH